VVYRDHIHDETRPSWLKLKGTTPFSNDVLREYGLLKPWHTYLNSMVQIDDVNEEEIVWSNQKPGKKGPKVASKKL
jgi:hypothetical protein